MIKIIPITGALIFSVTPLKADYMMYGIGVSKCSVLNTYDAAINSSFDAWLGGFITGTNMVFDAMSSNKANDITNSTNIGIISAYVKDYCMRNQSDSISAAAGVVMSEFLKLSSSQSNAGIIVTQRATAPVNHKDEYTTVKTWDSYITSSGRYITRTLQVGSVIGTYRLYARDHDSAGNSNGGSICNFNANGWSDCVGNGGNHYNLKPESVKWFMNIAGGAEP